MSQRTIIFGAITSTLIALFSVQAIAENLTVKKMVLAEFKPRNHALPGSRGPSPNWPEIDRHTLTVDDSGHIYVLNVRHNEILMYDVEGKFKKVIRLKAKLFEAPGMNCRLEVSGDGREFLVDVPSYSTKTDSGQFIFDPDGRAVRRFSKDEVIVNFPDARLCNSTYLSFQSGTVYSSNFQRLEKPFTHYADSEGKYRHLYNAGNKDHRLIKYDKEGKQHWEKPAEGNFRIVGIDHHDFLYVEGRLAKGDRHSLYKLSPKGEIVAQAPIPDPFPFLTKGEREERESTASEELPYIFKLACNGDVYLIYQPGELPSRAFKRWLKGGQYFIHKFETAKNDPGLP